MKLVDLMDKIAVDNRWKDVDVSGFTSDSRKVQKGNIFVCIKGEKFDGHDHAGKALDSGAAAVVVERDLGLDCQILVDNTRHAYAVMCANEKGNPSEKLKLIAVTGTNGKTTITYLIKDILESAGKKAGLIGTIKNEISDMDIPATHTTPDPAELHSLFARMVRAGCEYVVMEASSHALDQHRLDGCVFEAAAFTNLTQDHLDYHGTMERYFEAKALLFGMAKTPVLNLDDEHGALLAKRYKDTALTFSIHDDSAALMAKNVRHDAGGVSFEMLSMGNIARINFAMPGDFSVSNALAAAGACIAAGLDFQTVAQGLNHCRGVRGRAEILDTGTDYTVMCDYAHSPDGLEKVLSSVKEYAPARVVALFGCAGNRDRTKRKIMAEAVAKNADFIILTSDNPRSEDPMRIIEDAMPGLREHETPYVVIPDRYQAIHYALDHAQKDDIIVLAGKGHEDYQVLSDRTIYFDEHEIVLEYLKKKREQ